MLRDTYADYILAAVGEEENNCKASTGTRNVMFSEQHLSSVINRAHVWSESHKADPNNSNL